jgi:hypothetical protein
MRDYSSQSRHLMKWPRYRRVLISLEISWTLPDHKKNSANKTRDKISSYPTPFLHGKLSEKELLALILALMPLYIHVFTMTLKHSPLILPFKILLNKPNLSTYSKAFSKSINAQWSFFSVVFRYCKPTFIRGYFILRFLCDRRVN